MELTKAASYFSLFLTELRGQGLSIPCSNSGAAAVVIDGFDLLDPDDNDAVVSAEEITHALRHIVGVESPTPRQRFEPGPTPRLVLQHPPS